jgi:hypothetical protein
MSQHDTLIVLLTPNMKERLKFAAFQERRTMSEVVRSVIADYLDERGFVGEPETEYRAGE